MHVVPTTADIGARLRTARGDKSQHSIAEAVGVDQSTIARWECGAVAIPAPKLAELLTVLGLSWSDLDGEVIA